MRLHNRLVKAEFWTDTDPLMWPRDKRLFYLGLVQLADDSGCLEDNVIGIRVQLFRSMFHDADITPERIQTWLNELAAEKKVLRYDAGKACLYLVNFHKHQTLKTPTPPETPLPPWISWTPFPSNPRAGKYVVSDDVLTKFLQSSYTVLTTPPSDFLQSSSNRREENLTEEKHSCASKTTHDRKGKGEDYPPEFEALWTEYPRRLEKRNALKAWKARLKEGTAAEQLLQATKNYAAQCKRKGTEQQYIKHAAKFLGPSKPFEDYLATPTNNEELLKKYPFAEESDYDKLV